MMSRRQSIVLATVTVVLLIGLGAWLVWPESAVTLENATKIRPGMRLTEVEEILGGPACDDRWGPASGQLEDGTVEWEEWRTLSLRVFVTFRNGQVRDVAVRNYSALSITEKLLRWWNRL